MTTLKVRVHVSSDGTLTGQAIGLPAGEHLAELVLTETSRGPVALDPEAALARVRAIQHEVAQLPVLDGRSPDEIIGYNEHGHFG